MDNALQSHLDINLDGEILPSQKLTYIQLPFDVPDHIDRIDATYQYDSVIASDPTLSGGNTIDIGIFDPRGVDFLKAGFRGWSGSARSNFFVAHETATPGYMPGPIQQGRWHICLGAYKVAEAGCHYQVNIRLHRSAEPTVIEFPLRITLDDSKPVPQHTDGWYKGELHCHTVNSDGDSSVEEIVRLAENLQLDFLAITDHNNLTHQVDMKRAQTHLTLIPGLEVTTYFGHWNIWGSGDWVDFRIQNENDLSRAIAQAREEGYLVSCNHPRPYGPPWAFPGVEGYQCVEVWNGPWQLLNTKCLSFWEERLARGERLTAVGGSDHHFTHKSHIARLGHPTTFVYTMHELDGKEVLNALHAGHAFVTESPDGPQLHLQAQNVMMGDAVNRPSDDQLEITTSVKGGEGSRLEIRGASGVRVTHEVLTSSVELKCLVSTAGTAYIRAQLVDPASGYVRALTNPIYITG